MAEYDPDAAIDSQGQVIGDYVLGKTIGRGTFGKVKIGMHLSTGEKVAVKILEKCRILEIADAERVAREIKILKRNFHTNVIQLYQVIDTSEAIYLVMEYIDGGEMFEYIVKHHRIREKEAVYMFLQIVEALDYLHQNDVTHRDLKPENLLLQGTPASGLLVKVVDFGLSNTHEGNRLLQTACGSPCYAAPEMIEGKLYIGPKADIWSLGVILFAMVCGYLPFEDNNTSVLYKKILSGQYKAPNYISPSVQDLIRKILETNPDKRLSLADIQDHAWCKTLDTPLPLNAFASGDKSLNDAALAKLEDMGLKRELVVDAIQKGVHTAFSAAYYLMLNKVNRPSEPTVRRRRYSAYNQGKKNNVQTALDEAAKAAATTTTTKDIPGKQTPPSTGQRSPTQPKQDPVPSKDSTPPSSSKGGKAVAAVPQTADIRPNAKDSPKPSVTLEPLVKITTTPIVQTATVPPVVAKEAPKPTSSQLEPIKTAIQPTTATMLAPIHAGPTSPVKGNAVQAGGTTARNPPEPSITAPPPHGSPCPLVGGGLDLPTSSGPPLSASSSVSSITSGRSGKHLVEGSGAAPVVGIQPMPPTESKDSRPKGRATIALGSVLAPLAQRSNEPALAIATNAKNMMPFNSNAAPIKPPPESVVAKKRVSRHGSILTGTDEPSNYDLEMMKMLVNRENYGTGSIKEEKRSKDSLRTDTSESTLLPNASSVMNVIKASSSKSGNDDSFKLVAQRRSSHDGLAGAEPANSGVTGGVGKDSTSGQRPAEGTSVTR
ncbi:CAMK/CAMKL/AMPK protein kinase, variant [Aphanomyces astaci]|uniref:CAMK/CAMKL/AMPK protein kinase, variant n=1 Tax=Aphanomyces astaci TaxID=112090 RepID=W4GBU9_APHAT|nr:CAMK/CAMKL/AMPK protein kinase, variant [Aphanomyces astaci]ETV76438.1 CAMK/CAMKL/AMPK protein kinase, variant [Aphanomyces astaci]|eukprot:XP_009833983.1 CAMK/CAMKL/AMPK protein kinase, variant [Aphanomyces astaci]